LVGVEIGDDVIGAIADGDDAGDSCGLEGGLVDGGRVLDLDTQPDFSGGLDLDGVVVPARDDRLLLSCSATRREGFPSG
jgi:hypothetical protein